MPVELKQPGTAMELVLPSNAQPASLALALLGGRAVASASPSSPPTKGVVGITDIQRVYEDVIRILLRLYCDFVRL